nr:DUF3097 family protein [Arthrobacter castelli]
MYEWGPQELAAEPKRQAAPEVAAEPGVVLEDAQTGWVGAVVRVEKSGGLHVVALEDRRGKVRSFGLGYGFMIDGRAVKVVAPAAAASDRSARAARPARTASGSVRLEGTRARTARASRIWVEGKHDAELVEKVWGDDLRVEGIVVEPLGGIDDLAGAVKTFSPGPQRRLGVLVDHLVSGSKESAIAKQTMALRGAPSNVLIVGHPYVDVWQAVKPSALGLRQWPHVPRGQDWKTGVLKGLGWPHQDQHSAARGWQRILAAVNSYADLEPSLLGRVEEVIDFLTATPEAAPD